RLPRHAAPRARARARTPAGSAARDEAPRRQWPAPRARRGPRCGLRRHGGVARPARRALAGQRGEPFGDGPRAAGGAMSTRRFTRLLIANRGEIALRIPRTARRLGIATTPVHSDPDARTPPVAPWDDAWRIAGPTPAQRDLSVDKRIAQ
ncbi:biotin carboxylase N-terminal domain-containing protein, partial [Burkholderia pseudomallei]|uniref:biotin carboxylase N-terminal domain-containing protein n=1 Tax=Burkholderia pseudomallei TaxID=28450 RepID=UPI00406D1C7C